MEQEFVKTRVDKTLQGLRHNIVFFIWYYFWIDMRLYFKVCFFFLKISFSIPLHCAYQYVIHNCNTMLHTPIFTKLTTQFGFQSPFPTGVIDDCLPNDNDLWGHPRSKMMQTIAMRFHWELSYKVALTKVPRATTWWFGLMASFKEKCVQQWRMQIPLNLLPLNAQSYCWALYLFSLYWVTDNYINFKDTCLANIMQGNLNTE